MTEKLSFEEKIKKLENILENLECSSDVENNIKLYEDGVNLYKDCRLYLDSVEKKINILSESLNETPLKK